MSSHIGTRNVGAIDPRLKTSPVLEEMAEESYALLPEVIDKDVCYFNGQTFATGEFVCSGTAVLECREGVWMEIGPADPDNP